MGAGGRGVAENVQQIVSFWYLSINIVYRFGSSWVGAGRSTAHFGATNMRRGLNVSSNGIY